MNRTKQTIYIGIFTLVSAMLGACGNMYSGKPHLGNTSELQSNEIVLVGRIELVPPLSTAEQELKTVTSDRFQGKAAALFSDQAFDLDNLGMTASSHAILVELDKDFYTRQPKTAEILYSGSVIMTRSVAHYGGYQGRDVTIDHQQLNLPGGLKYTVKTDDRAVYVGTIRYHRDDYNAITKVELINDYKRTNKAFTDKFGTGLKLRYAKPEKM